MFAINLWTRSTVDLSMSRDFGAVCIVCHLLGSMLREGDRLAYIFTICKQLADRQRSERRPYLWLRIFVQKSISRLENDKCPNAHIRTLSSTSGAFREVDGPISLLAECSTLPGGGL